MADKLIAHITTEGLNVHDLPNVKSFVRNVLSRGDLLVILDRKDNWVKVRSETDPKMQPGWVDAHYLHIEKVPPLIKPRPPVEPKPAPPQSAPAPDEPTRPQAPIEHTEPTPSSSGWWVLAIIAIVAFAIAAMKFVK